MLYNEICYNLIIPSPAPTLARHDSMANPHFFMNPNSKSPECFDRSFLDRVFLFLLAGKLGSISKAGEGKTWSKLCPHKSVKKRINK